MTITRYSIDVLCCVVKKSPLSITPFLGVGLAQLGKAPQDQAEPVKMVSEMLFWQSFVLSFLGGEDST